MVVPPRSMVPLAVVIGAPREELVERAASLVTASVPAEIVVLPVKVFGPESVQVPVPVLVSVPALEAMMVLARRCWPSTCRRA